MRLSNVILQLGWTEKEKLGWTEKEKAEKILNSNIKEWTRCSIPTVVRDTVDRDQLSTLITYDSIMTPLQHMTRVTGWDEMRRQYQPPIKPESMKNVHFLDH